MTASTLDTVIPNLHASAPAPLPFADSEHMRAYALRRPAGDLLVYGAPAAGGLGDIGRQLLNHWHEAAFGGPTVAPLLVHAAEAERVAEHAAVDATFSERAVLDGDLEIIPIPGHMPGATAFLWDSGQHRVLFTGDSVYVDEDEWVAAVLPSSDRAAYVESLDLLRTLDFDVLVPWIAGAGETPYAFTDPRDTQRRIGAILDRLWRGEAR